VVAAVAQQPRTTGVSQHRLRQPLAGLLMQPHLVEAVAVVVQVLFH
jgi:hypothetical protein